MEEFKIDHNELLRMDISLESISKQAFNFVLYTINRQNELLLQNGATSQTPDQAKSLADFSTLAAELQKLGKQIIDTHK